MSIYITGDTHREFDRIQSFCDKINTTKKDIMIILGDAGINYYLYGMDINLKSELNMMPITFFCIHGNHEERPYNISFYQEQIWHGGTVYIEPQYPNLIFAKDGEIYDFDGEKYIAIGGAYSVDKYLRIVRGMPWFESEQPNDEIKAYVEKQLDKVNWQVDGVLSHTVPIDYEPREDFLPEIDQSRVDKTTELWLGKIEKKLKYKYWYAGHFHTDKQKGPIKIMFKRIEKLGVDYYES